MVEVHPTASVHPDAHLGEGTRVGAYAVIEPKVVTGKNCVIHNHAVLRDYTTLGDEVQVHPFAVIGGEPQHLKFKGEPTTVQIGNKVVLRESVTVHRGTVFGHGTTVIHDGVYLMAYSHVAHDCVVGPGCILANTVQLAGHVTLGRNVTIGGVSAVTQFCTVGDFAFIGGGSLLRKDLPPFLSGKGNDFEVQALNVIGLERQGFSVDAIRALRKAFRIIYLQKLTVSQALERATVEVPALPEVDAFLGFIKNSKQGIAR
ncbi:acyl-ACP--UDP-N-acetylglucosamine O-acyltransferase [bacterium]|nr:acyl-ACP--UDP-N-acetylglucosamine O-acyltransferase [bacterium]